MARSVGLLMVANVVTPALGLVSSPLLAQSLGVDGRGGVAGATAPVQFGVVIGTIGLPDAVTYVIARRQRVRPAQLRQAGIAMLLVGLVLTAVVVLLRGSLSDGSSTIVTAVVVSTAFLAPCLALSVVRAVAAGLQRWGLVAAEQALAAALRFVGIAGLILAGHLTVVTASVATAAPMLLGGLVYLRMLGGGAEHLGRTDAFLTRTPDLYSYGVRVWIGYIGGILLLRLDQVLMVPLSSAHQLGLYAVAVTVAEVPLIITNAVRDVTFSADAASSDDAQTAVTARLATVACGVVASAVVLASLWLITPLFGSGFAGAYRLVAVLALAVFLLTPGSVAGAVLTARGLPGRRSASLVAACVVNAVLLVAFVPSMGAMGAALATLVGNVTFGGLNLVWVQRLTSMRARDFLGVRRSDPQLVARALGRRRLGEPVEEPFVAEALL